jgi:hypothetical protein
MLRNEFVKKKLHLKVVVTIESFVANRTREMTESNENLFLSWYPVIVRDMIWDIHKTIIDW